MRASRKTPATVASAGKVFWQLFTSLICLATSRTGCVGAATNSKSGVARFASESDGFARISESGFARISESDRSGNGQKRASRPTGKPSKEGARKDVFRNLDLLRTPTPTR